MSDLGMSALRLAIPIIFAAYGGMLSERSGVANIALEAYLLVSAFVAATVTLLTGNIFLGALSAVLATTLVGALFGFLCVWGRGDQIVIGMALNLLVAGIIPIFNKTIFDVSGSTPALALDLRITQPGYFLILAIVIAVGLHLVFQFTRHGLRITAAGNQPLSLSSQGVSVRWLRLRAIVQGSFIASLGGIYLSLCMASGYIRNMSAGRGFLALAALIFGSWKPIPTLLACLFFGLTDALQIQLQGVQWNGREIPNQFVQMVPFGATLLLLIFFSRRMQAPRAINRDEGIY